jgi:cation diffusion facilitator family transporter
MDRHPELHQTHQHVFLGADHQANEKRTWLVVALTGITMVVEVVAGIVFGSMALLADGFHMATHAGALAISAFAYRYARRHAEDRRFSFGTGKLGELAGYSSALLLAVIALLIGYESFLRLTNPTAIRFEEAIAVAVLGLLVNILCAWILRDRHHHHDHSGHSHADHHHGHHDHNIQAAYLHVIADALTSVLAIAGLVAGRYYGWIWLDPVMGIAGALLIARWSWILLKSSAAVLLDATPQDGMYQEIQRVLEQGGDRVTDLHLWRVGPGHTAAVISLASNDPKPPAHYKQKLNSFRQLSHVTVEIAGQCSPPGS